MLVRHVWAGERLDLKAAPALLGSGELPTVQKLETTANLTVQGEDAELAHIHCARQDNPDRLYARVTFGPPPELTTLRMLAVTMTSGLLRAFHRHAALPPDRPSD